MRRGHARGVLLPRPARSGRRGRRRRRGGRHGGGGAVLGRLVLRWLWGARRAESPEVDGPRAGRLGRRAVGRRQVGVRTGRRRAAGDEGFTLVELLLTVTIMSIVVGTLSMALILAMRTTDDAADRMAESQSAQLLNKWLPGDVQQADPGPGGVDTGETPSGCAQSEGSNVVRFRTTSTTSPPATSYVSYRLVQTPQEWRLVRFACDAGEPGDSLVAAHLLQGPGSAIPKVLPDQVFLTVIEETGYTATVLGARVLDGAALACTSASLAVSDAEVELTAAGGLPGPVLATATPAGFCDLSLAVSHEAGYGASIALGEVSGWQGDLQSLAHPWVPGTVTLSLVGSDGSSYASDSLELTAPQPPDDDDGDDDDGDDDDDEHDGDDDGDDDDDDDAPGHCWARLALSPATLTLTGAGELPRDVAVSAQVGEGCPSALTVRYQRSPSDTSPSVDISLKRNRGWSAKIDKDEGTWAAGAVEVEVRHGNRPLDTATLTLLAAPQSNCSLVDTTPSAGPDNVAAKPDGWTKQEIRIVMQPTTNDNAPCLGLAARLTNDCGQVLTFLVVAEGQNVTAKIPKGTGPFTANKTVAVEIIDTRAGNAVVGHSSFRTFRQ
ncbi:MAG: prepilin-type N-terminal cleavage/methylation domain-containing protein [Acidimicrobiia bacterium]|nr:prepilin-type N-terminal cleavage/methylation domain-containing protein [Acidimicrobiia bacterium]